MQEFYVKEEKMLEKTELENEREIIENIIETKKELDYANCNFQFAESELIDYYIYQIKANQAKLDYLIKLAKIKGLNIYSMNQKKSNVMEIEDFI